jgi:hypothetical protein
MISISERLKQQDEVFRKLSDRVAYDIRVAAPAIIKSFDPTTQTATVRVAVRERINIDGVLTWKKIPLLIDVPVFMPRAGGYVLTMPVASGDECLVVFADSCIDGWWQSGGVQNQIDRRRHDLSDGFALVGVWSRPRKVTGYSADSAQLRNEAGTAFVDLSSDALTLQFGTNKIILSASGVEINP